MNAALFRKPLGFWVRYCAQSINVEQLLTAASRIGAARS